METQQMPNPFDKSATFCQKWQNFSQIWSHFCQDQIIVALKGHIIVALWVRILRLLMGKDKHTSTR